MEFSTLFVTDVDSVIRLVPVKDLIKRSWKGVNLFLVNKLVGINSIFNYFITSARTPGRFPVL